MNRKEVKWHCLLKSSSFGPVDPEGMILVKFSDSFIISLKGLLELSPYYMEWKR